MIEPWSSFAGGAAGPDARCLFDAMWAVPRWFGLGFDAMMGRMMHSFAGMASRAGMPSRVPPGGGADRPVPAPAPLASRGAAAAAVARQQANGGDAPVEAAREEGPEGGLAAEGTKLVEYTIVSIRRCAESILPGGTGTVVVPERMTGADFAVWMVANYVQFDRDRLRHEDKRHLRVYHRVLTRWAAQPWNCCDDRRVDTLEQIRNAIRGLERPVPKPPEPVHPLAPDPLVSAPASPVQTPPPPVQPATPSAATPSAAPGAAPALPDQGSEAVLRALRRLGGTAATAELVRRTRLPRTRVRRALHDLEAAGRIRRSGDGLQTRYHEEVSE